MSKETNPKDQLGSLKLPLHLWPMSATAFGCIGLANGMLKYGRSNWRHAGVRPSIYVDAAMRHLTDWFEGNEVDPEDGVHNLAGALACLAILVDAKVTGKLVDDRNFNGAGWREARALMEPHMSRLLDIHAGKSPKHYTIADAAQEQAQ
ncbi:MAG TPA: dATP/dGTP diphosphohydrolase domain-containing protein [Pseudomonas sp.]|nr:dATP/dGTP diphosphohydrolase domain-containing protein [Pseudomonas sp.]